MACYNYSVQLQACLSLDFRRVHGDCRAERLRYSGNCHELAPSQGAHQIVVLSYFQ